MVKEKIEKLKNAFKIEEGKNNKKAMENMVVFAVILIITIVAINYIWASDKSKDSTSDDSNKKLVSTDEAIQAVETSTESSFSQDSIEEKLKNILSNIKGVGNVNVLITYSQTSQIIPMYDEDSSTSTTQEEDSSGGTRTTNESSSKKEIIYEEENGVKTPITQTIINPKIEGAIVTAQGANDAEIRVCIIQAVEAVTGLATYKIQVFEME